MKNDMSRSFIPTRHLFPYKNFLISSLYQSGTRIFYIILIGRVVLKNLLNHTAPLEVRANLEDMFLAQCSTFA